MICAAILAGGKGIRMGKGNIPKQFLELNGKPIIIYTIEKFSISDRVERIIVGVPDEWKDYTQKIIKKYFQNNNIDIITGRNNKK